MLVPRQVRVSLLPGSGACACGGRATARLTQAAWTGGAGTRPSIDHGTKREAGGRGRRRLRLAWRVRRRDRAGAAAAASAEALGGACTLVLRRGRGSEWAGQAQSVFDAENGSSF